MNPKKIYHGLREYAQLFVDGEADLEDYILAVLLLAYSFILVFHILPLLIPYLF